MIKIPKYGTPLSITDQQWLDHCNQNNHEFANRQILLKGDGAPTSGSQNNPNTTKAPFGSFYKNNLNGDRYEQVELDPVNNDYDWQLFGGGTIIVDKSKSLVDERDCDSGLAVGDLVWESMTTALTVDKATSNNDTNKRLVIGMCISKPTSTTADILFKGPVTGLSDFSAGKKVYVGSSGGMTSTLPTSGFVQIVGNCSDGTHVDFSPAMHQTKRA